jgi:protease IV
MKIERESIFISMVRSFFVSLFSVAGILVGIAFIAILIGALMYKDHAPTTRSAVTYLPNAKGERDFLGPKTPVILTIDIKGFIGAEPTSSCKIENILLDSREGPLGGNRVKALLLNINSGGGTVRDSNAIYRLIKTYKERYEIPVYAYVDDICASGAYQIASIADKIYAVDSSVIGSVGILVNVFNFSNLLDKVGVEAHPITAGTNKDMLNPFRPWKEGEEEELRDITKILYENFLNIVVKNRKNLSKEKLIHDYGARVFSSQDAKEYGFIDEDNASYEQTLYDLTQAAELGEKKYQVVKLHHNTFFNALAPLSQSPIFTGKITHQLNTGLPQELATEKFLYLYNY